MTAWALIGARADAPEAALGLAPLDRAAPQAPSIPVAAAGAEDWRHGAARSSGALGGPGEEASSFRPGPPSAPPRSEETARRPAPPDEYARVYAERWPTVAVVRREHAAGVREARR